MTFKEKLVALRKASGLTQEQFARKVGVSRQSVYKWECGQSYPEAQMLLAIRALFAVSIDVLLDDTLPLPELAPVAEAPVAEEPVAEAPAVEEPAAEAPAVEEPVAEEPVVEEPAVEAPAKTESRGLFGWLRRRK